MTVAYPLHWPVGYPRTKGRTGSRFDTSIHRAVSNVNDELRRFGNDTSKPVQNLVISSNVTLGAQRPADPGIAIYFRWDGIDCCIAVDRYEKPEDNLQAIAKVVDAERAKMRHGGLAIVRASFRGYAALPPPKDASGQLQAPWWQTLGLAEGAALPDAEAAYRRLVKETHPDRGGDAAAFNLVTNAIRQARESFAA